VLSTFPKKIVAVPEATIYMDQICLVYRPENRGSVVAIQAIVSAIKKFAQQQTK
jgi:hypothetical protein